MIILSKPIRGVTLISDYFDIILWSLIFFVAKIIVGNFRFKSYENDQLFWCGSKLFLIMDGFKLFQK